MKINNILIYSLLFMASVSFTSSFALGAEIKMREFRGNLCYDGDTCYITMPALPQSLSKMSVRILGIDTPEIKGKCNKEKGMALLGRKFANNLFKNARDIEFKNLKWDKYGGRVLADVYLDGNSYSELIIKQKLARPYDGGAKKGWCE
tara:strand:+ start:741 stop:1184 length:444 start_codon:yes stop_codon:yes gene_type:complete